MNPAQRQAHLRTLAHRIIGMREHLLFVAAYRAAGLEEAARYHLAQIDRKAELLPLGMRRSIALARYVGDPAQRHLDRVGVLTIAHQFGVTPDPNLLDLQRFAARMEHAHERAAAEVDNTSRPWDATDDAGHEHLERDA